MINHGQRGRMDDQRCSLDPSRSAPCTPRHTRKTDGNNLNSGDVLVLFFSQIVQVVRTSFI